MGVVKIRWRTSDISELRRTVRNFNQQRRREIARNPESVNYLPDALSLRKLRKEITTRAEFNRETKSIKKFANPKMRQPVKTSGGKKSKWEIGVVKQKTSIVNKKNKIIYDKMMATGIYSDGKPTGYKRAEMGTARLKDFEPIKFDVNSPMKDWKKFVKNVEMRSFKSYDLKKQKRYYENYKKHLENLYWDDKYSDQLNTILKVVDTLSYDQLEDILNQYEDLTLDGEWDSDQEFTEQDLDNQMQSTIGIWNDIAEDIFTDEFESKV